jgi:hypothetical protein
MALQIIGSGFGRTGTLSLKVGLEHLGFPCYHMMECFPKGPSHWALWEQTRSASPPWDTIFDGYTATVDFPASTSFAQLAAHYPEAKVVHTTRDPEKWFDSTQATIFQPKWVKFLSDSEAGPYMATNIDSYFDHRLDERDHMIRRFQEHEALVRSSIPPERLLVFNVAEGWGPLCEFLELPIPNEPFPHINDSAAIQQLIDGVMEQGFQKVLGYDG